jgi:sodium transport system permease protein
MRPQIVWTIFRKEITDMLRDRLTLLVVIALPVLVYPLLILGITKVTESQTATLEAQASKLAVWGEAPQALTAWLERTNTLALHPWLGAPSEIREGLTSGALEPPTNSAPVAEARSSRRKRRVEPPAEEDHPMVKAARDFIAARQADAVLVIWPGFEQALENDALGKLSILYDSVRPSSSTARERLNSELAGFRRDQVAQREREHNLAEGFSRAVDVLSSNVAAPQRRQGEFVGSLLPLLLIMLSVMGGLHPSIDLTAGEKDRNTMQTLLCAPVRSVEIVGGKFLAIWSICLIAALANTASLAATLARVTSATGLVSAPPSLYFLSFLALLPVTFTITAFFLAVAALARDAKDAGNFLGPALIVLTGPLALVATPAAELNAATAFVPVVNIGLLIKSAFIAEAKLELAFLALFASALYAMLALLFAARLWPGASAGWRERRSARHFHDGASPGQDGFTHSGVDHIRHRLRNGVLWHALSRKSRHCPDAPRRPVHVFSCARSRCRGNREIVVAENVFIAPAALARCGRCGDYWPERLGCGRWHCRAPFSAAGIARACD